MTSLPLHALHTAPRHRPSSTPKGIATAHFGTLREPLLRFINGSDIVVGCVAWVTDREVLSALAKRPAAIVVQKENWWKKSDLRGQALARRYADLRGGLPASLFPDPLASFGDAPLAPISCVGYGAGAQHQPLMHHKFVVRCAVVDGTLVPLAVWTGSFNFSNNANDSFENAVEIHDPSIAAAYLAEFALVASVSEPMNWRLAKPSPKGVAAAFVPPPAKTTKRVVKKGTGSRRGTKKATGKKTTASKTAANTTAKKATATRGTKKATASKATAAKKTTRAPKAAAKKTATRRPATRTSTARKTGSGRTRTRRSVKA